MTSQRSPYGTIAASALAMLVLVGLGVWQVYRLNWKNDLEAKLETAVTARPVSVGDIEAGIEHGYDVRWLRVRARGLYDNAREAHLYDLKDGKVGWRVLTPLVLAGDYVLWVDRGFVPDDKKAPASRPGSQVTAAAPFEVTGILRTDDDGWQPFTPDNEPERNRWFRVDLMALYATLPAGFGGDGGRKPRFLPFYLKLEPGGEPGERALPIVGPVTPKLVNNHLSYALTWFSLAVVLLIITIVFLLRQRAERQ